MSALFLFIGGALGGAQGMMVGFLFAVVTNFVSYWFSDKIVLRMYGAQEVGPGHRLYDIVSRLAERASLPQPRCYVIPQDVAERVRDRPRSRARRRGGDRRHPAHAQRRRARRRARSRARAREASRHPDQLGGGDAGRRHHDARAVRDVLRRRPQRQRSRGQQSRSHCSRR